MMNEGRDYGRNLAFKTTSIQWLNFTGTVDLAPSALPPQEEKFNKQMAPLTDS